MRTMVFAYPTLLGLLQGQVDIYVDATFNQCSPNPFLQCLIVMVFDNQTSCYVLVVFTLMTHKYTLLYYQVFTQLKTITKNKIKVRIFTSNFERAEMNMLEALFGNGKHVGCLFHWKQAIFKYLKRQMRLGEFNEPGSCDESGGFGHFMCLTQVQSVEVWYSLYLLHH
jgi:hypothetical protein